jgi:hypothetical protein
MDVKEMQNSDGNFISKVAKSLYKKVIDGKVKKYGT